MKEKVLARGGRISWEQNQSFQWVTRWKKGKMTGKFATHHQKIEGEREQQIGKGYITPGDELII